MGRSRNGRSRCLQSAAAYVMPTENEGIEWRPASAASRRSLGQKPCGRHKPVSKQAGARDQRRSKTSPCPDKPHTDTTLLSRHGQVF